MKNALFWVLVAVAIVFLVLIGYGIYLSVTNASSGLNIAAAVCTGFILVGSLVAWEVLMKPGYYRRRRKDLDSEESEGTVDGRDVKPPSR